MLRIHFTAEDLASTRFLPDPAPLLETKLAVMALRNGIDTPWGDPWRRRARRALPVSAAPLMAVVADFTGNLSPSFLGADLPQQLDELHEVSASPQRTNIEIRSWYGSNRVEVPRWTGSLSLRQASRILGVAIDNAFSSVVLPYWPDIRAHFHREVAQRARTMALHGVGATLTDLLPGSRWRGDWLEVDGDQHRTVRLGGRGLVLTPSTFWHGPVLVGEQPDVPVLLAYSPRTVVPLRTNDDADPLAGILGSTRAAVLRLLLEPRTTSEIARQLGISPASASEHAAMLRTARLVESHRDGKSVVHVIADVGLDLVRMNAPR